MRVGLSQQPFRRGHGRKVNVDTRKIISKEELEKQLVSLVRGGRVPALYRNRGRVISALGEKQQEMKTFGLAAAN
jgi:hypothetical protein